MSRTVQPQWSRDLTLQQQSVLLLAARGPDNIAKTHPCKVIQRAYRATVLVAARYGRMLRLGEAPDTFMALDVFADAPAWYDAVYTFLQTRDGLPHHFQMHLLHGAEIIAYKHPDGLFRDRWRQFYFQLVLDMHLTPETEAELDARLNDWGRAQWTAAE